MEKPARNDTWPVLGAPRIPLPPVCPAETYSPDELRQIVRLLSEYNIEISIRTRRDKTRIFEFREGQGNLKTGLEVCDKVLNEKFGIDLTRLLQSLEKR
ncbi:MAG TPA: hypothetical protein VJY40_04625 [Corynebacterium sp.]|jgi:hypothetical protein|nr:hypothetical protein [Corynebacterium sp.]HRD26139.1 hypothetical protein [Methanoculleus sp.]